MDYVNEAQNLGATVADLKTGQGYTACVKQLPPDGVVVMTKIHDANGLRNEQRLKRRGRLWWHPDGKMYVYYTPTHWKAI